LRTFEPKGAFYAFPDLRGTGLSDDEFCNRLLQEEKVAIVPGNAFGDAVQLCSRLYATSYEQLKKPLRELKVCQTDLILIT
jgi:aminotransferase